MLFWVQMSFWVQLTLVLALVPLIWWLVRDDDQPESAGGDLEGAFRAASRPVADQSLKRQSVDPFGPTREGARQHSRPGQRSPEDYTAPRHRKSR